MDNVLEGPKFEVDFQEAGLGQRYFNRLESFKDEINQVDSSGISMKINAVKAEAIQVAAELLKCGAGQDDVILMTCKPKLEEAIVVLAVLFIGAQLALVDPDLDYEEFNGILRSLNPRVIFCDPRVLVNVEKALGEGHGEIYVFSHEGPKKRFKQIFEAPPDPQFEPATIDNPKTKTAFIFTTAGVSKPPKLVKITHYGALARALITNNMIFKGIEKIISYFPLCGTTQIILILITFERHLVRIIPRHFEERDVCRHIHDLQIEFVILGTDNAVKIAKYHSNEQDYNVSCLKQILIGGVLTTARIMAYIISTMANVVVSNIYVVLECGFIAGITPEDDTLPHQKPASCGKLFPGGTIKILDLITHEPVGPDTWGELCYQGITISSGYFVEDTNFTDNGFFHSGDVAQYDAQGCLYIQGKVEDIAYRNDISFSVCEIEEVAIMHENIIEAVATCNHLIILFVVLGEKSMKTRDIFKYLQEILPRNKWPNKICIVNEIPKTKYGKVKKYILSTTTNAKKSMQIF